MTLPKPCTVPDCPAPITHWHDDGEPCACYFALRGEPCPHGADRLHCYAPRATNPLHLPDVEAVARVIYEGDGYPTNCWATQSDGVKDDYRRNARDVLDLIAAHQPVWHRVEPADITVGDRVRLVTAQGDESIYTVTWRDRDWINGHDETRDVRFPHTWYIDPRTVPTPTLTERIRAALDDSPESRITLDAADVEALLDMAGGEQS